MAGVNFKASPKQIVREVLDHMPENASLQQLVEEIALVAALAESMDDLEKGRVIPQSEAMARMKQTYGGRSAQRESDESESNDDERLSRV